MANETYQERLARKQRESTESIDRMSRMSTRPKPVTAKEMAAYKATNADLYKKGGK